MFCKNCGKEIDDNAMVCIHCGAAANIPQTSTNAGYAGPNGETFRPVPKCKKCGYIGEFEHGKLFRPMDWAIGLLTFWFGFGIIYFIVMAIIRSDEDKRETICPQCKAKKSSTNFY